MEDLHQSSHNSNTKQQPSPEITCKISTPGPHDPHPSCHPSLSPDQENARVNQLLGRGSITTTISPLPVAKRSGIMMAKLRRNILLEQQMAFQRRLPKRLYPANFTFADKKMKMKRALDLMNGGGRRRDLNSSDMRLMRASTMVRTEFDSPIEDDSELRTPPRRFRRTARFIVKLYQVYSSVSQRVRDALSYRNAIDSAMYEDMNSDFDANPIFDKVLYKAKDKVPSKVRRMLQKVPHLRSEYEIKYIRAALEMFAALAQYPIGMQMRIARKAWYETHPCKSVILREGDLPLYYHVLLSGKAVAVGVDTKRSVLKTLAVLEKGDAFGEMAIINNGRRTSSVITKEKVELLYLDSSDYIDIILGGGLNPEMAMLRNLRIFDEWPLELLRQYPRKARQIFYKKGTVLVVDSRYSDWIFIVTWGTCDVYIRLRDPEVIRKENESPVRCRPPTPDDFTDYFERKVHDLDRGLDAVKYQLSLPDINISTRESYRKVAVRLASRASNPRSDASRPPDQPNGPERKSTQLSGASNPHKKTQGPHFQRTTDNKKDDDKTQNDSDNSQQKKKKEVKKTLAYDLNKAFYRRHEWMKDMSYEEEVVYAKVRMLSAGDVFGLSQEVFPNQPSLSLVSNGAQFILVEKSFYKDNLSDLGHAQLKSKVIPYDTLQEYQRRLQDSLNWEDCRNEVYRSTLEKLNVKLVKGC